MRERGGRVEGTESGKQNDSIVASISQAKFYARYSPDLQLSTCSPPPPPPPPPVISSPSSSPPCMASCCGSPL